MDTHVCERDMQSINKARRDSTIHESWAILICIGHKLYGYTCERERCAVNTYGTQRQ